jgi:DNA-binding SARP family transcriptional activator
MPTQSSIEFHVLGPLEVVDGAGRRLGLGGRRQRALLACLLIHANEVVPAERLIEELWGNGRAGANALQVVVSRLRKTLGRDDRLLTEPPGYRLRIAAGEYDRDRFEQLLAEGRRSLALGALDEAAQRLSAALELWRGPPFADFLYEPFAQAEIARLEEAQLACLEERIEADLALGRHAELVGELEALTREHPLRERPRAQLMLALYRSGRQADALELYRRTRQLFDRDLGIEPGPALRELEAAILRQDSELHLPAAPVVPQSSGAAASEPEPQTALASARKTVTVLVTGVAEATSSVAQDPELSRRLDERAFAGLAPVLERHGATVERLRDGRVMGIFGVPTAHEDDALRAVRAAVELRDAVAGTVRTGIDSGEVLTRGESAEPLVTGAVVELAAAFQQACDGGEILVGEATRRLVRDAITSEPLDAAQPRAWRLLELNAGAPPFLRRFDAPLIGRDRELAQLRQAFERARDERRAQLFTVFGEAGIGKTRLAHELARSVEGEATVLTGRCLSYGEGITYWPVREMVTRACAGREIRELLGDDPDADAVAERLESAVGTVTSGAVGEEIFWAFRKLAESLAHELPLVLVFEDVHWAEPTLLDLIEYLADWVRSDPVLLVCLARPELLDGRATWGGGKLNASSILLEPLSEEESTDLIGALAAGTELSPQASRRIAEAAEGNPLFLEQMLAMLAETADGTDELAVPPAIQALLSARLDHLTPDERHVIECASVEGELFHLGGVAQLSSSETVDARSRLTSLVRKELIRPESPTVPGEEAFGFRHALIRDAAYASLSKQARSDLHERYAGWLERALGNRVLEGEEFLGYHLEQAHRYRAELGVEDEATEALAARAGELLASAGRRAFMRGDWPATVNLYERGLALLAQDSAPRRRLMPDLALALRGMGSGERAAQVASEAVAAAEAAGDVAVHARAEVTRTYLQFWLRPDLADPDAARREAERALAIFDELDDDTGRTRAIFNIVMADWTSGNADEIVRSNERSIQLARRTGNRLDDFECCAGFSWGICWGTTRASDGRRRIEEVVLGARRDRSLEALAATVLALLEGMQGRLSEAQALMEEGRRELAELGLGHWVWQSGILAAQLAMLATDFPLAERVLREALDLPGAAADLWSSTMAQAELTRAVHAQGRHDEALAIAEATAAPSPVDFGLRIRCRGSRALALGAIGRLEEAEELAREAVELGRRSDFLNFCGDALVDLAAILSLAGRPEEAAPVLEEAIELYERKGNVVSASRARSALAAVR